MSYYNRLTFAWWNTGLAPVGKPRYTEDQFTEALGIIAILLERLHVDFLGLGEITSLELSKIMGTLKPRDYFSYDGTLRMGNLVFDTGAIYNVRKLSLVHDLPIVEHSGNRSLKLANRLDLAIDNETAIFHIFVSHWPSHLQPDSEPVRTTLACRLRYAVNDLLRKESDARVILMGDYNEEPFHESLESQLLAIRDRSLVRKNPSQYLYNPFWRHIGESVAYNQLSAGPRFAGTCFLSRAYTTHWKTVDQIIISSAFLGRTSWHLNEQLTMILPLTDIENTKSSARIFDHLPVIAVFEKKYKNGVDDD